MKERVLLNKKGSILAYSLIILGMFLVIAAAITVVTAIEKKSASATQFSTQAYQIADSGIVAALKEINEYSIAGTPRFRDIFSSCGNENPGEIIKSSGLGDGSYYIISFHDSDGNKLPCDAYIRDASGHVVIDYIKSIGIYRGAVRAIEMDIN